MERDLRQDLVNALLTTPHRNLASVHQFHADALARDPRFYVHLAAWYADNGQVRDHQEMFVALLALSDNPEYRDVGLALLRRLAPYQVARMVDFVKGTEKKTRVRIANAPVAVDTSLLGKLVKRMRRGNRRAVEADAQAGVDSLPPVPQYKINVERVGLFRNVPRSMRTEIERYLREREADDTRFDKTAVAARKSLKRLYAGLHIAPSARAQAWLFADAPPADSTAFAVKQIAKAQTPEEQARAIVQHRIPYRVAATIIKDMSPMVLAALIEVMTPQEVINNLASLKKRGVMENPDLKSLVDVKLAAAQTDKRVSAYKAKTAIQAANATGELAEQLNQVTEVQIKRAGKIARSTALLIDKSGSMSVALEVGKQLGALASAICEAELYAYAFDTVAYAIQPKGKTLADWEKALSGINADGGTSCGVALEWMARHKQRVEQIVMVTDEDENTAPTFKDAYEKYASQLGVRPSVIFVKVGTANNKLERVCVELGIAPNVFEFRGDYYALPNVIPLLTYPSLTELVMDVLNYPLPKRQAA